MVLFWYDVYGQCIRLDFSLKVLAHDRSFYNDTEVVRHPERFFAVNVNGNVIERVMTDTGFQGFGKVEAPHKKN